jgi:glyoxylase-like metal-dependent hydrolase (beta-lactamase superfamily II)
MKEIIPGIYLITLTLSGFSPGSVNIYLIRTDDGYLAIDTGWDSPPSFQSLEKHLAEIGARFTDIKQVIVTHCHIDHLGMIVRLKQSHNAKIYFHQNETDLIKIRFSGGDNLLPLTDKFLQSHGFPKAELPPPEVLLPVPNNLAATPADVLLHGGEEIAAGKYVLRVINTPGHTQGHISLYEPSEKLLFSGDVLLPTIATNAALHVQHIINPLQQYLDSLKALKELDVKLVLPGHEHPFSNHRERIDELLQLHLQKEKEIWKAMNDRQPKTAYDVSRILSWSPRTGSNNWPNLSGWDKRFAVLQTIAYLETLRFSQKAARNFSDGVFYYVKNE